MVIDTLILGRLGLRR